MYLLLVMATPPMPLTFKALNILHPCGLFNSVLAATWVSEFSSIKDTIRFTVGALPTSCLGAFGLFGGQQLPWWDNLGQASKALRILEVCRI